MDKGNRSSSNFFNSAQLRGLADLIKFNAIVSASICKIVSLKSIPNPKDIVNIIEFYSDKFKASQPLKKQLQELTSRIFKGEISEYKAIEQLEAIQNEKEYEVYIDGMPKPKTRDEVQELESHKNEYLAWAWVDDEMSEIIVDKKKKDINPDTVVCKFLIAILKRVGKDLPHEIIEREVNIKDIHQHLNKLKAKTDHVLDKYIEGTRWRFKIHSFKSCLIIKRDI